MKDRNGYTGIPGLYVAGDDMHLTNPGGGNYSMGNGFTSGFVSIEGDHAGKAASACCNTVTLNKISDANINKSTEEIEHPLKLDKGFSPTWASSPWCKYNRPIVLTPRAARDVLQGIMAPYWVLKNRSARPPSRPL
jgi:hypothetical protein